MKRKGFTLIELLAVIVILAIIALIITPLISDLIESSRFASAVDSVLAYVSGANSQVAADVGIGGFEDFSLHLPEENELETGITDDELAKIKYKGKGPTYVYLHFSDDGKLVDEGRFCIWGYSIDYNNIDGASKGAVDYCSDPEPEGVLSCDVLNNNAYDDTTNFVIKTVEDLVCVSELSNNGKNFQGKKIYLAKNIDFNSDSSYTNPNSTTFGDINGNGSVEGLKTELTTGAGFKPIGTFRGTFEGYTKKISNLMINRNQDNIGFISINNGEIKGLTLANVDITGANRVGAVAGNNRDGVIREIILSGKVRGTGSEVAGVTGYQYGGGDVLSVYVKDIDVNGAGIVSNGWYSRVTGVVENGTVTGRCTNQNSGSASITTYCSTNVNYGEAEGTIYTPQEYMLNAYDKALDTYIGGDNDNSGYYFDYASNNSSEIVIKSTELSPIKFTLKGAGTTEEPYIIDSYKHFKEATTKSNGNYVFKITNDIDFAGKHFYSLGTLGNPLGSNINGDMHTLSNIVIGGAENAGFVTHTNGHTIEGIKFDGIKVASASSKVGGVAGSNNGIVKGITLDNADILGSSQVGGVVGNNEDGQIYEVKISGKVKGTGDEIGGVVGRQQVYRRTGIVASALVHDIEMIGTNASGLVGNGWYSTIKGVVESGNISTNCISKNSGSATIVGYCSNQVSYNHGDSGTDGTIYALNDNMINTYDHALDTYIGGDNDNTGYYFDYESDSSNNLVIKRVIDSPIEFTLSGTGTSENPYIIDSYQHFKEATIKSNGNYNFKITTDIDFAGKHFYSLGTLGNQLGSNINGDMHTLSNIIIGGADTAGFVSQTNGHTIEGLNLVNIKVASINSTIGAIAGANNGLIKGINVFNADISGSSRIGGIVGNNEEGIINEITISGKVTGTSDEIAGVVGRQYVYRKTGIISNALVHDIVVSGPNGGGIVGNGWYSTVKGVVESGQISSRCTASNAGAATVETYCSSVVTSGEANGTRYTLIPPTTVSVSGSEIDSLTYYDNVGILDTIIGGDNDKSGYYFMYNNSADGIIVVKAGTSGGVVNPGGEVNPSSPVPIIGESVGINPPTCVLNEVIPRSNGIQAVLTCDDEEGAPTIRSQWNVNKNAVTNQFSDIGIIKNGSVNGNSKTVRPYWSTSDPISIPHRGDCYYYRFGAMDASGNYSYYVTENCYHAFTD